MTVPSRLSYFDLATEEEHVIYDPNRRVTRDMGLVMPQTFNFQRDGFEIEGWYFPPQQATASHPAILYVHGGPAVGYGYTFFHEMQFLACSRLRRHLPESARWVRVWRGLYSGRD